MDLDSRLVYSLKKYNANKKIREMLSSINPLLVKKETNIRVHLEALINRYITQEEFKVIETKMKLGELCLDLENHIPDSFVTILFYCPEENKIYHGAGPQFPVEFFDFFNEINKLNAFNSQCGSCGSAVHQRKVVITDILTDPLWGPFREHFIHHGFQTGWSIPFYRDQEVIGTFAIYHQFQKTVSKEEIQLVQQKVSEYQDAIYYMSERFLAKEA
ncbi:GAF domain-containing protein [Neobacillus dielmonensis]|uniref:GAF domain-containing protein n=1 Tax=Neobacillus dielmonensis TaxID=1347369 RepID=UPI0005A62970|nr:GAF domain-containing protein [Neobacillus dielmonensis]